MIIRRATTEDRAALGRLGALLMQVHYDFDRRRFLRPGDDAEEGYADFLVSELDASDRTVFVAELDGAVVGYCYAGIEPLSWQALRDECGAVYDLVLEPAARRRGGGRRLLDETLAWFRERGLRQASLSTASGNLEAQRLFAGAGFRPTMVEMTLELAE